MAAVVATAKSGFRPEAQCQLPAAEAGMVHRHRKIVAAVVASAVVEVAVASVVRFAAAVVGAAAPARHVAPI